MPLAERRAEVTWKGNLTEGRGMINRVGSGALNELPITWAARTERSDGKTSPEELLAAAHAACFSMALSNELNKRGAPPERLDVTAVCAADRIEGKLKVISVELEVRGSVPGASEATFQEAANAAKEGCPVSGALKNNVEIRLKAELQP